MAQYKTKGIIIRRRNFGEADRILTIYTENRGKVSAIAKGVRKPLSKLAGHLELFYLTDLYLAEGKNLHIVTGAIIEEDFPLIRNNAQKINQLYYIAELIDKLIHEHEASKNIFDLLINIINYLERNDNSLLLPYFEIKLLSQLGHKPELDYCLKCRKKLIAKENYWDSSSGVMCKNCAAEFNRSFKKINKDSIKILRLFLKEDLNIIDKLRIDSRITNEICGLLDGSAEYISEKELKSKKFLRR